MTGTERPRVTIVSPFRDNAAGGYIGRYIERVDMLDYPAESLRVVCVEGDSKDSTPHILLGWSINEKRVKVVTCDTGKPHYGSVVDPERFKILAQVYNAGLKAAVLDDWTDYTLFIPSDVHYGPDLISRLMAHQKDIIAPMFWVKENGTPRFYDIWGFSKDGRGFPPAPPAWFVANMPGEPFVMDTVGGVMLCKAEVIRQGVRYTPEEVDHGLCKSAQAMGYTVWADPTTHVFQVY